MEWFILRGKWQNWKIYWTMKWCKSLSPERIRDGTVVEWIIGKGQLSRWSVACCSSLGTLNTFVYVLSSWLDSRHFPVHVHNSAWSARLYNYIKYIPPRTICQQAFAGRMNGEKKSLQDTYFWSYLTVEGVKCFQSRLCSSTIKSEWIGLTFKIHCSSTEE